LSLIPSSTSSHSYRYTHNVELGFLHSGNPPKPRFPSVKAPLSRPELGTLKVVCNATRYRFKTDHSTGINSLCDLILSVFPIVILWGLQMPTTRKLQLYAVLSTSYLALVASIIKTVRIGELSASPDFTCMNALLLEIPINANSQQGTLSIYRSGLQSRSIPS